MKKPSNPALAALSDTERPRRPGGQPLPSDVFRAALHNRQTRHPFTRTSAHRVREFRRSMDRARETLASVAVYRAASPSRRSPYMLLGCTPTDMAAHLKSMPGRLAHDLGYNLIPAIEALVLEGANAAAVAAFIQAERKQILRLIAECEAVQDQLGQGIAAEYAALVAGRSRLDGLCSDILDLANRAVALCDQQGL